MGKVKSVTAVTGNYPTGQKIDRVLIEYDRPLGGFVPANAFEVEGRSVLSAEAHDSVVTLRLDPEDKNAGLLEYPPHQPPKAGEKPLPPIFMPPVKRRAVRVSVTQRLPLSAADGGFIAPDGVCHSSDRSEEPVVDKFVQDRFAGIAYNLFAPEKMREGEKYPLVMFIHDAGPCGSDPKITLSQGFGAIGFAEPSWQAEHPCFVLAPQIDRGIYLTTDEFTCSKELEDIKALLDHIVQSCPVDTTRIYATGQSMGCMASCELNIRYPELFAASLLVGGQWDPERMGKACRRAKLWIAVSEGDMKAFPIMTEVTNALERGGARVGRYRWDASLPSFDLSRLAESAMADKADVRFTVFTGTSVVPHGEEPDPGKCHINTWRVAYTVDGFKKWLFSQRK